MTSDLPAQALLPRQVWAVGNPAFDCLMKSSSQMCHSLCGDSLSGPVVIEAM